MAKPVSQLDEWASAGVYASPGEIWDGQTRLNDANMAAFAADGFTPDLPDDAPTMNSWLRRLWSWVDWLSDGSAAAGADAHLVETDSTGEAHLAQLEIVSPATYGYGLDVDSTLLTNVHAIRGRGGSGANGHGIIGRGGTGASVGCYGVGGTGGTGVRGEGEGAGAGGVFVGGATGSGLTCSGGATSGVGAVCTGVGASAAITATGGATNGAGITATPGGTAGHGVDGRSHASATSAAAAVRGLATADGSGVLGQAADGYGVVAVSDSTTPTRSSLRISPQDADPTTLADGDVWQNSTTNELSVRQNSGTRRALWRTSGQCYGFAFSAGPTTDNAASYTTACSASLASPNDPKRTGSVRIRVTAEVGRVTSAAGNIEMRVRDTTSSADCSTRTVELFQAVGTYERDVSWEFLYTLPASGARSFEVQIRRSGGSDVVGIRNVSMTIDGVF